MGAFTNHLLIKVLVQHLSRVALLHLKIQVAQIQLLDYLHLYKQIVILAMILIIIQNIAILTINKVIVVH
jgi:hypothetical protein